jgi:hypothetical protein
LNIDAGADGLTPSTMSKLPAFQFYPGDWRKDPNLSRCTKAEKGVWIDVLCLMFECEVRGVLSTGGLPWGDHEIAAATGGDTAENLSCISELLRKGVAHRNSDGAVYSRRMVRDEQVRKQTAERVNRHRGRIVTTRVTHVKRPCTEDEEEIEVELKCTDVKEPKNQKTVIVEFDFEGFSALIYADYPRKVGRDKALPAIEKAIRRIVRDLVLSEHEAAEYLHKAVLEFAKSPAGNKGTYTPHCASWMNGGRWDDDREEWFRESRAATKQQGNNRAAATAFQRITGMDCTSVDEASEELSRPANGGGELSRIRRDSERHAAGKVIEGVPRGTDGVPEVLSDGRANLGNRK